MMDLDPSTNHIPASPALDGLAQADLETQLAAGAAFLAGFAEGMAGFAHEALATGSNAEPPVPVNRLTGLI